jgi:nitrogen fixation NifU-like protein
MGKIRNPDGIGKVGNIVCGDVMWLYLRVAKNQKGEEVIKDIKFETFGCTAAIATSSMITDLAKGKTFKDALEINKQEITDSLGGLPPIKVHCSVLASDALIEAIHDYLFKNKKPIPKELTGRHLRIKREREMIEERYKEWIEKQKVAVGET